MTPRSRTRSTRALLAALVGLALALAAAAWFVASDPVPEEVALEAAAPAREVRPAPGGALAAVEPTSGEAPLAPPATVRREALAGIDGLRTLGPGEGEGLAGLALDHATGGPLPGVRVRAFGEGWESSATSDEEGRFELSVASGSAPLVEAEREGYAPLRRALGFADATGFGASGEDDGELVLHLRPGAVLAGRLTGVAPELLEGGTVHLWDLALDPGASGEGLATEPDGGGAFAFLDLAAGEYTLLASVPGHRPAYLARVTVPEAERVEVELELAPGATISGYVTAPGGEPRPGVRVSAAWNQEGVGRGLRELGERATVAGEDGAYELAGLASGTVIVLAEDGAGAREAERVEVREDGEALEQDLVLPLPGALAGVVRTPSGLGVANAVVQVLWERDRDSEDLELLLGGAAGAERRVVADLNGRFRVEGVPAGRGLLARAFREEEGAPAAGGEDLALLGEGLRFALDSGEVREDLVLEVQEPREVVVVLRDRYGRPAEGVELSLDRLVPRGRGRTRPVRLARGVTDAEGRCAFPAVLPGGHELRVGEPALPRRGHAFEVPPAPAPVAPVELAVDLGELVEGVVVDELGDAVPEARVRAALASPTDPAVEGERRVDARADGFGRFRLGPLAPGTWELTARAAGHEDSLRAEVVRTAEGLPVVLVLERSGPPGTASVHGRLFVTDGGAPEDLSVEPRRGGALELDGDRFRLTGLRAGEVNLGVGADGYLTHHTGPLRLLPGMDLDLGLVELAPAGSLRVYARDAKGEPLGRFTAELEPLDGQLRVPSLDRRRGTHRFEGRKRPERATVMASWQVPMGHWKLSVRARGHAPWSREVVLDAGRRSVTVEAGLKAPAPKAKGGAAGAAK